MNKKAIKRRNEEQWRQIIVAQEAGDQSVSVYCRGKDFSDKSFYIWRRKLRNKSWTQASKFLEVTSAIQSQGQTSVLRVHTPGGYRLEVPRGLEGDTLRSVLKALASI